MAYLSWDSGVNRHPLRVHVPAPGSNAAVAALRAASPPSLGLSTLDEASLRAAVPRKRSRVRSPLSSPRSLG